jgi:hypothetical protein
MSQRMVEQDALESARANADMSPLEKAGAAMQAARLVGSGLTQLVMSMPTRIRSGDKAAEKYIEENIYQPTIPKATEYVGDFGEMMEQLETKYKLPPIMPELLALQGVAGPATGQAAKVGAKAGKAAGMNALQAINDAMVYQTGPLSQGPLSMLAPKGAVSHVFEPNPNWKTNTVNFGKPTPGIMIPSKMSNVREAVRDLKGNYGARRVERAADEIPNLERMYQEDALKEAFTGDNANAMITLSPAEFERYALELKGRTKRDIGPKMAELARQGDIDKYTVPMDEYIKHLQRLQGGFNDVPYLNLFKDEVGLPTMSKVTGHEGRHRSRALAEQGAPTSLVQINPRGDLREGLPRRTQEEFIEALKEELERSNRLVLPESDGPYQRPAIEFPEPYAEGGSVNMAAGGLFKGVKAARKGAPNAERSMPARGALRFADEPAGGPSVIKEKGGNWLNSGSVARVVDPLKSNLGVIMSPAEIESHRQAIETTKQIIDKYGGPEAMPGHVNAIRQMQGEIDQALRSNAINSWADRNLTNYIKNQMGTPEDPVRRLAEEGIVHIPADQVGLNRYKANTHRATHGGEQLGKSEAARAWEDSADVSIEPMEIKDMHPDYREPWMEKADPKTKIYEPTNQMHGHYLGFNHIMDVLREDLASGRIRPEQLNKVSMEQAVRRTYEYDQELAAKMNAARAAKREGLPVQKEYPEGYRWVELNRPGAFASESEAMGHSVRGYEPPRGHPDWTEGSGDSGSSGYGHGGWEAIKSGKAKVYSLVDPKGEPHVTVEVGAPEDLPVEEFTRRLTDEQKQQMNARKNTAPTDPFSQMMAVRQTPEYQQMNAEWRQVAPSRITQIKGKGNAAPKEEYLPFVQDFVKGGKWSDVGDLQNTRLTHIENIPEREHYRAAGMELPDYVTDKERDDLIYEYLTKTRPASDPEFMQKEYGFPPPEDGMKRGGSVHISDNPDTMMMEVGDQHFALGGAALKMARANKARQAAQAAEKELALPPQLPRAKPRSKEELRPLAQEMAEATRGDFYRPEPSKSFNPAGKSFEQWKTEQGLVHDIRPTAKRQDIPRADIEKQKGMVKMGISGDTSVAEQVLHEAGPYALDIPSPQHGGALYGLGGEGAWASNNPIAANVQKRINEISQAYGDAPVLGQYMQMGKLGSDFALHFADANLRAIDLRGMSKDQIEMVNELIRKGSPKSGPRPSFPGIEDKDSAYLHFAVDPELRKHFNAIMQKPTYTEPLGLPDGRIIHHAITEPELRDLPVTTTGFSQMELAPGYDPEKLLLSEHPTYSHVIPNKPGTGLTRTQYHTPAQVEFPDVYEYLTETAPKKSRPQDMTRMYQTSSPRQIIDQQHIDEIKMFEELMKQYGGKKEGGAITVKPKRDGQKFKPGKKPDQILKHGQAMPRGKDPEVDIGQMMPMMAGGGEVNADDLILEERPL